MCPPCQTEGCGKPATLFCPTCKKLGLPPAPFCSQACFKANWPQHKWIHKMMKSALAKQAAKLSTPNASKSTKTHVAKVPVVCDADGNELRQYPPKSPTTLL